MHNSHRAELSIAIALTLVAAGPRFYRLGALGFYGDEDLSVLAARAVVDGQGSRMPSGMPYRRALPLTWLTALSAHLVGEDREAAYRLPAAVLGALTIPALFLIGSRLFGTATGVVAALMLALSEWHIVFSRQARMYAPFLLFFLIACWAISRWTVTNRRRDLVVSVLFFSLAVLLHEFGIFAVLFALLPLVFPRHLAVARVKLLCFAILAGLAAGAYNRFTAAPFTAWPGTGRLGGDAVRSVALPIRELTSGGIGSMSWPWSVGLAVLGGMVGLWMAAHATTLESPPKSAWRAAALYACGATAGALVGVGQLYGAGLAGLMFLLVYSGDRPLLLRRAWMPLGASGLGALTWLATSVARFGLVHGLRRLAEFPFPYAAYLFQQFPILVVVFGCMFLWLAFRAPEPQDHYARVCLAAVTVYVAVAGAFTEWCCTRYLLPAYPFLLLASAAGLNAALVAAGRRTGWWKAPHATAAAVAVVLAGVLGGHGLPQAVRASTLRYGQPVNAQIHMYPFRPDHKGPGEFLRRVRARGDVIVAERPTEQQWYAGRVDYFLRSFGDAQEALYRSPDGRLRETYVNSVLVPDDALLLDSLSAYAGSRVWLVTSGETYAQRAYYLAPGQRRWLDSLQRARPAAFTGQDGVTHVYCLNCGIGKPGAPGTALPDTRSLRVAP